MKANSYQFMKSLTSVTLAFTSIAASAGMWFGIESPILENVHLAITVSNNVVTAGSTLVLSVSITNSSTVERYVHAAFSSSRIAA